MLIFGSPWQKRHYGGNAASAVENSNNMWEEFVMVIVWLMAIAVYVLNGIAFMKLAGIAGRPEIGWMAWVPVANVIQQLLLIKKSGWLVLLLIIPIVGFIMMIIWQVNLLNAFGKSGAYVLFYIFISPVYEILWIVWGFSSDTKYNLPPNGMGFQA